MATFEFQLEGLCMDNPIKQCSIMHLTNSIGTSSCLETSASIYGSRAGAMSQPLQVCGLVVVMLCRIQPAPKQQLHWDSDFLECYVMLTLQ